MCKLADLVAGHLAAMRDTFPCFMNRTSAFISLSDELLNIEHFTLGKKTHRSYDLTLFSSIVECKYKHLAFNICF